MDSDKECNYILSQTLVPPSKYDLGRLASAGYHIEEMLL